MIGCRATFLARTAANPNAGCAIATLLFASTLLLPSALANAQSETSSTEDWNNSWSSTYSRALGGSQTGHAVNEDALYSNPAALAKTRNPRSRKAIDVIEAPNLVLGGNQAALRALKGKGLQPSAWLRDFAISSATSRSYLEFQTLPWTVLGERGGPSYFFGLPIRSTFTASPSSDGGLSRQITSQTTATAALNATLSSRSGSMSLGITARPNVRWSTQSNYNLVDIVSSKTLLSSLKSSSYKTTSTAFDLGVSITAGDYWLPTFGLSILNLPTSCVDNYLNPATGKTQSICGAKRVGSVQDGIPSTRLDPTEIRAGLSIIPRMRLGALRLNMKISGDAYPLPISTAGKNYGFRDVNINQLTHAGIEIYSGNALSSRAISLRAGLNDTRTSLGFCIPMPHFTFEGTTYEAAVFTDGKATKERRYLIGLSSDW
ncbi:hypothetical protein EBU99_02810 [bacterium]|nr:hypothetical protein [bacterium]